MKIDAKALAKEAAKSHGSKQRELGKEGEETEKEVDERGDHMDHMMSLIEAIHMKDPKMAHEHMMNYAKSAAAKGSEKPSEPQDHE